MKPVISSDPNKRTCSTIISASCVLWHGPDLECIDTCAGDSMVDVITKTATEVCALKETLDLTGLQLDCLSNSCTGCTLCSDDDKVLKNILECIIKKYCLLKTQVDALPTTGGSSDVECPTAFNIDATCIEGIANRSLSTAPTNNEILQLIADATCISYQELSSRIDQLNIDLIACCNSSGSGSTTLPQVNSSCLFVGLKDIDEAYLFLDADYCDLKSVIGDYGDLTTSLNPEGGCSTTINTYLGTTLGGAFTLDAALTGIYDAICKLVEKVEIIETIQSTCCVFSCDDIQVVILGEIADVDAKLATLVFTFNGSINFPSGYTAVDTGSKVTFTDKNGTFITYSVDIFDDATYTDLAMTGLDLSGNIVLTADIKYEITDALDNVYNCNKCISGLITINNDCGVCELIITGGTAISLKITYEYDGDTNIIVISSTGTFFIPKGATITSIVDESSSSPIISTNCTSLVIPSPATLTCWRFAIPEHMFSNGEADPENDAGEFSITGIISGGIRYNLAAPDSIPSHLGVKGTDECSSCSGGSKPNNEAYTSLTGYTAGGITYTYNATMAGYVNQLNLAIGSSNPVIKQFTSACTNDCNVCMDFRFLHVQTYGTSAPYLELTGTGMWSANVIIQVQSTEIETNCYCEGE